MYPGGQGRHLAGSYFAFLFLNILVLFSLYLLFICDFLSFHNLFYANVSYSDTYAWVSLFDFLKTFTLPHHLFASCLISVNFLLNVCR